MLERVELMMYQIVEEKFISNQAKIKQLQNIKSFHFHYAKIHLKTHSKPNSFRTNRKGQHEEKPPNQMIFLFFYYHSTFRLLLTFGIPPKTYFSIPHSFVPRLILKNPLSPQSSFHELAISQYGVPFSSPQPMIFTECPPSLLP